MGKRVTKSIKGEEVDFDLLETKQKMAENKPRVMEVKQREDFVHTKRRSRGRKAVMERLRLNKEKKESTDEETKASSSPKQEKTTNKPNSASKKKKKRRKIVKKEENN